MSAATLRKFQEQDLGALVRLINRADQVDRAGYVASEERLAHELANRRIQGPDSVFVAECGSALVGYVWLQAMQASRLDRLLARGIVHPGWRRRGIGTLLMKRVEKRAQELGAVRPIAVYIAVREPVAGAGELALSLGYRRERYFYYVENHDLKNLPEPAYPEGIVVRDYAPGQDEEAFVAAYTEAFADHWGAVPHTREQERHRVGAPAFRPEDNLLAVDAEGQIAGLCLLEFPEIELHSESPDAPLIDDLAVRPAYRRRGIGRALMLSGMRRAAEQGYSTVGLAVDADNPNQALRLYESLGFVVKSRSTVYRKEVW